MARGTPHHTFPLLKRAFETERVTFHTGRERWHRGPGLFRPRAGGGGAAGPVPPGARQVPLKVSRQPRGQWRRGGAGRGAGLTPRGPARAAPAAGIARESLLSSPFLRPQQVGGARAPPPGTGGALGAAGNGGGRGRRYRRCCAGLSCRARGLRRSRGLGSPRAGAGPCVGPGRGCVS